MQNETFTLNYEMVPHGTDKTQLIFVEKTQEIFEKIFTEFDAENEQIVIATDDKIAKLETIEKFLESAKSKNWQIQIIKTGEENKTIENVLEIIKAALSKAYTRSCTFIAIGGGVISDMTAMAASLFKRGAKLQIVPTTLLSMADASIGGKTGCDFSQFKNMIGTFYPANKIYFCPEFLKTLSENEYYSGLGEVIKTAMLYDIELFDLLKSESEKIKTRQNTELFTMIKKCALAKAKIVEQDITEKNIRKQLNLGHTFAHALESVAGFGKIPHGKAVSWGLARAILMSYNKKLCSKEYVNEIFDLLKLYGFCTESVPQEIANIPDATEKLINAMRQDKKNENGEICFILQKGLTQTVITNATIPEIKAVL